MTPEEADQRIILSKRTLWKYVHMAWSSEGPFPDSLPLFREETSILLGIAQEHPGTAMKIEKIVEGWIALEERAKLKLN